MQIFPTPVTPDFLILISSRLLLNRILGLAFPRNSALPTVETPAGTTGVVTIPAPLLVPVTQSKFHYPWFYAQRHICEGGRGFRGHHCAVKKVSDGVHRRDFIPETKGDRLSCEVHLV